MNQGMIAFSGTAEETITAYLSTEKPELNRRVVLEEKHHTLRNLCSRQLEILSVELCNEGEALASDEPIEMRIQIKNNGFHNQKCQFTVIIFDSMENRVLEYSTAPVSAPKGREFFSIHLRLMYHDLFKGFYKVSCVVGYRDYTSHVSNIDGTGNIVGFEVRYSDLASKREYATDFKGSCKIHHSGELVEYCVE